MIHTMTGYSAKSIDEMPTLWDGFAKLVRPGLEITAFGANIMDLPPDYSTRSHDESESGQQELYVAVRGSGSVDVEGAGCHWTLITLYASMQGRPESCRQGRTVCACSASAACLAGCTSRRLGARLEIESEAGCRGQLCRPLRHRPRAA